jgi:hypothetical protein
VPDSPDPISDEELERASAALARVGISLGALHARWAHILVEDIGRLAREGLAAAEERSWVAQRLQGDLSLESALVELDRHFLGYARLDQAAVRLPSATSEAEGPTLRYSANIAW